MSGRILGRNCALCKREVQRLSRGAITPPEAEIVAAAARLQGLLLVAGRWPIGRPLAPVAGACRPTTQKCRCPTHSQQHPARVIADRRWQCAARHPARMMRASSRERCRGDEPALLVALLRPGIGKQDERARDAGRRAASAGAGGRRRHAAGCWRACSSSMALSDLDDAVLERLAADRGRRAGCARACQSRCSPPPKPISSHTSATGGANSSPSSGRRRSARFGATARQQVLPTAACRALGCGLGVARSCQIAASLSTLRGSGSG